MPRRYSTTADPVVLLGTLTLAVCLAACGQTHDRMPDPDPESRGLLSAETNIAAPPNGGATGAIDTLDICALMPVAEVARVLEYDPSSGTAKKTKGRFATDCTYSFAQGEYTDYAIVWAYPPGFWASELYADDEEIVGLGDSAYLSTSASFAQINILLEVGLHLDIRANTTAQARSLAELAISRLGQPG